MFGGKGDGVAQAQAECLHHAVVTGFALGLVGHQHDGRVAFAQPAGDFLVQRGDASACIDDEQGDIGIFDRRLCLHPHAAGQGLGVFVLITSGVDDGEFDAKQVRLPFPPIARDAGLVIDQRQLLADEPVEEGGLAHIGPPYNGNCGQHDSPFPLKHWCSCNGRNPVQDVELGSCHCRSTII